MRFGHDTRSRRSAATWAAMLLAAAPLPSLQEVPLQAIAGQLAATGPTRLTPDGLAFDVQENFAILLPLAGMESLQVDYRATGNLLLSWGTGDGGRIPSPSLAPWHHLVIAPGNGRATLDLITTPRWSPERVPFLFLQGAGSVVLTGLRARPAPGGREAWTLRRDEALRWAPLRIGHTTINHLDPPTWKASDGVFLFDLLGIAFAVIALGGALAWLALRRRWRPAPFLATAGVAAALAGNVVFLVRAWPALALRPVTDPGSRLRENFHMDPELGALAALARESVRPDESVGIQTKASDWFAWETLCFHLAPRRCVRVVPEAIAFEGLSGSGRLAADQLDVVIYLHAGVPLLPGYSPAESLSPRAFVARRR